jgi:hypothetical protein
VKYQKPLCFIPEADQTEEMKLLFSSSLENFTMQHLHTYADMVRCSHFPGSVVDLFIMFQLDADRRHKNITVPLNTHFITTFHKDGATTFPTEDGEDDANEVNNKLLQSNTQFFLHPNPTRLTINNPKSDLSPPVNAPGCDMQTAIDLQQDIPGSPLDICNNQAVMIPVNFETKDTTLAKDHENAMRLYHIQNKERKQGSKPYWNKKHIRACVEVYFHGVKELNPPTKWKQHYESVDNVFGNTAEPIHVARCLDPPASAAIKDVRLVVDLTDSEGVRYRDNIWIQTFQVDRYLCFLNAVGQRMEQDYFYGFSPFSPEDWYMKRAFHQDKFYKSAEAGFQKLRFEEVARKFQLIAVPFFINNSHWTVVILHHNGLGANGHISWKATSHCSLGDNVYVQDLLEPFLKKKLGARSILFEPPPLQFQQNDDSSCGPRTLITIEQAMIQGTNKPNLAFNDSAVYKFRYLMMFRCLNQYPVHQYVVNKIVCMK